MMLAVKVRRDRARADQAAGAHAAGPGKRNVSTSAHKQRVSKDHLDPFRSEYEAASSPASEHQSPPVARRKRASVVAIVKKRVEMLHMNFIARDFPHYMVR